MKNKQSIPQKSQPPKDEIPKFSYTWIYLVIAVFLMGQVFFVNNFQAKETTWNEFVERMLVKNDVEKGLDTSIYAEYKVSFTTTLYQNMMTVNRYGVNCGIFTVSGNQYYYCSLGGTTSPVSTSGLEV